MLATVAIPPTIPIATNPAVITGAETPATIAVAAAPATMPPVASPSPNDLKNYKPKESKILTGSFRQYPYRSVSPPAKRMGSFAVHLPVSGS